MSEDRIDSNDREYTNGEITVFWKPGKCIHATTCYRELIEVFNPRKRPWVNMLGAPSSEIVRVVGLCPTEALAFKYNEGHENIQKDNQEPTSQSIEFKAAEVRVMRDGPLIIKGSFKIIGADGKEMRQMKMVSFCRCGQSRNMPYCDGHHRKVGFTSD